MRTSKGVTWIERGRLRSRLAEAESESEGTPWQAERTHISYLTQKDRNRREGYETEVHGGEHEAGDWCRKSIGRAGRRPIGNTS